MQTRRDQKSRKEEARRKSWITGGDYNKLELIRVTYWTLLVVWLVLGVSGREYIGKIGVSGRKGKGSTMLPHPLLRPGATAAATRTLNIAVGSKNPCKVEAVDAAFASILSR